MAKFFSSDWHFFHKNICAFTDRSQFTTPDEHNQWLLDIINDQTTNGDIIYHLGDLAFVGSYDKLVSVVSQINAQLILIGGNHCNHQNMNRLVREGYATWFGDYKEVSIDGTKTCLFHYPICAWRNQHHGSFHLFGHTHASYIGKGKSFDVGLDNAFQLLGEHRLFTEEDIIGEMSLREIYTPDHHKA